MIAGWKISAAVSAVVVALLIVVACAPAAAPTATPAPKPAEQPKPAAAAPTNTPAPAAAAKPTEPAKDAAGAAGQAPAAAAAATTIAQQSAKPAEAAPTKPAVQAAAPAKPGEKVTLRFLTLSAPGPQKAFQLMAQEYKAKVNPNVELEIEAVSWDQLFPKIQAISAAKTPYDIIWADGPNLWSFAYNGVIAPLDEWFDRDFIQKSWLPSSLITSYYRGKFFAPPERESCSLLWYNKDATDKAGIDPPAEFSKSWTMEEALVAWQKVNNPPAMYGLRWGQGSDFGQDYENGLFRRLAATSKNSPAFKAVADDGLTMTGYFDHPEAVKGHQFLQDIHQKYKISPVEAIPDAWFNQKVAFYLSPDNAIGTYERLHPNGSFKYGVTGIPYFKGGTQICHNDSLHYALGAYSQHKKEAAEFIKFMSGEQGARIYYEVEGQLPAHAALLNSLPAYQKYPRSLVLEQFKQVATPRVVTVGFTEYNTLAIELFGNLIQIPGANVQELATQTAKRADSLTAKYKDWQTKPIG
ncbi:MAG TPA: sugar ABC transporter substrate-binding protein [Chloroflexota bacterium]|nr:sugar ABC transporter substrate-binding protein [Chloroflexota bacterium]